MATGQSASLVLIAAVAAFGLTGCEKIEQAANEAVEKAKQSAAEALDQTRQSGSIENARQSADEVLQDVKQQAAGFLDQASEYLRQGQRRENEPGETEARPVSAE